MQREDVPFCRTSFQITFFCRWKHIAVDLEFFVLPTLEKIQPNFAYWCLVRDLGGITFCKKGNSLCFQRMLWKSSLYTFPSSLFLILRIYTELIVTVFNRTENRSTLVWDTVFCSLSKKSRLFYTYNNFRKNCTADYSFIALFLWCFQNIWVASGRR